MKKIAFITGASRGIGYDVAKYFAEKNYNLIILARDEQRLVNISKYFNEEFGTLSKIIAIDVCDFPAVEKEVLKAINELGHIDVLVNAAGIFLPGSRSAALDDFSAMLNTNVTSIHHLCKLCHPFMGRYHPGWIFNIASICGIKSYAGIAGYVASKHALVGYSLSIGQELIKQGIKVTTICPDVVNTDMSEGSGLNDEEKIATSDITRAIDFVMSLSPSAIVEQITIGRKPKQATR
ncbi:SDR family oxidoreductase [Pectobacterium sp. A5351]|uniref:SDR family oxidoreductase n=1 Tax=Pectobacterium sp. A5351 TaxID=2914983 RepID=UPI00232B984A|nr:SDR family oxidoreductase [Pectobacterium sp. A5351]WCG82659.1 SDR family NAD(P)-dependent oxidoreductase [Pectobacterium sp. A5351]